MITQIILLIFFLVLVLGLTIFSAILLLGPIFTGFRKAPYVPSFDAHLLVMKNKLKLKKGSTIVDLGCGDGKALRFFSKEFGLKGNGYDSNPFVIVYGRFLNFLLKNKEIRLIKSDFKKADLARYDYVFLYLFPEQLHDIEKWVFAHVRKDTIIISNSFVFVKHTPFEVITDNRGKKIIYLYRV